MVTIRKINELEYMIAFAEYRSVYSDRCALEAVEGGQLLMASADEKPVGYLCCIGENGMIRIIHAFTIPEYRQKGVFTELLGYVSAQKSENIPIRLSVLQRNEFRDAVVKTCRKLGFEQSESVKVFTCHREQNDPWCAFMEEKGYKMCRLLNRWGYEAVSFENADDDIISQLRATNSSEYGDYFDVAAFLDNPGKKTAWDMSFAAVKDGRLAAYSLVTRDSESAVVFQIISDSLRERGSGAVLLPFVESMNSFYKSGYKTASYAMYGSNTKANAFRFDVLGAFKTAESTVENYYKK